MRSFSYRNTWVEVSLDAIYHNIQLFKSNLSGNCLLMAVIKADGYGHGANEVALAAIKAGANYLGVAFLDEALQLRDLGVDIPILILGYTPFHAIAAAIKENITMTVASCDDFNEIALCAERLDRQARVHLKVDTGMSRLGFTIDEAPLLFRKGVSKHIHIEGIFTHFADADNSNKSFTQKQYDVFVSLINNLSANGINIPIKHCCNSAAAMKFPEMHMDMVRIGISMYGLSPLRETELQSYCKFYPLQQAMQFKTTISFLKKIAKNHTISYGRTYRTKRESLVATLPVGYADGLARSLSNKGIVLIRGKQVPIVGKVCMDQTMIDVTSLPNPQVGDEVVIFGSSEGVHLSIIEIASLMDTIPYEVVCLIGKRVPRIYYLNNGIVSIHNHLGLISFQ